MSNEPAKKKDELLRLLSDVESEAHSLEGLGQDVARSARLSLDIAAPLRDFVSQVPEDLLQPDQCDRQIESWRSWESIAGELRMSLTKVNTFVAVSNAVASTCSSMVSIATSMSPPSPPVQIMIGTFTAQLGQIFDRPRLLDEVQSSMRRLGLDPRLLNEAHGALERPVLHEGGAVSVLLALRECIHGALAELLRRRPMQEPASKMRDKLTSLGRQCAHAGLQGAHFDRLGADGDILLKDLSSAKQADMTRPQQNELFNRGLLFLNALMSSVDETRLRPV